jgi:hypothetical protein
MDGTNERKESTLSVNVRHLQFAAIGEIRPWLPINGHSARIQLRYHV